MQNSESPHKSDVKNKYRNYVLAMLTLVYVFNFVDRQLLIILQESIKKELHLSDTQLGLLSGFSFAIFYVSVGIPIARFADRGNRRNVVAASLGLWSAMTAFSGLARNFIQLLLARIGVGVGEAGGSPPAHAMISDYFPPEKRSTALSVYSTGIYFGVLIGFLMGGYLNQHLGWRTAFFVVGLPGTLFCLLFYATVKEPRRGSTDPGVSPTTQSHPLIEALKILYAKKTFVYLGIASALLVFCIYGLLNWAPSFLSRLHGMKNSEIGLSLGLIYGISGAAGTFFGGWLTDLFGKKDKRWYLKVPAYAVMVSMVFAAGALFFPNTMLSISFLGCCAFLQSTYLGPSLAVAHGLVPASMRAITSAVFFLAINLLGLGFGPLTVGWISDLLAPALGTESLRWAMSIIIVISMFSAVLFLIAAAKMEKDRVVLQ
jgi:MFS family permease